MKNGRIHQFLVDRENKTEQNKHKQTEKNYITLFFLIRTIL